MSLHHGPGTFIPTTRPAVAPRRKSREEPARSLTFYFFWTWHRGTTQLISDLSLSSLPLDFQALRAKTEALLHHWSQLARDSGDPILPDLLLVPARRPYEVFLVA